MIEAIWVVGTYKGELAKKVLANTHASVGSYIALDQSGKGDSIECTVAFRYAGERPLPHHLVEVQDPHKITQYEKTRKERQGLTHQA